MKPTPAKKVAGTPIRLAKETLKGLRVASALRTGSGACYGLSKPVGECISR
jgi:hypothetical protein